MAQLLRGAPVARALMDALAPRVDALCARGVTPTLAVIRVGERQDDLSYERNVRGRCEKVGIAFRSVALAASCTQGELMDAVAGVNADAGVHGCLMFRPLPAQLDEKAACAALAPEKDVDGVSPLSLAGVFSGDDLGFAPCTAEACVALLDHYGVALSGKRACVVGRSLVVGRPLSLLLQARDATVTMCHSRTEALAQECARADLLLVATGRPKTAGAACTRPGQVIVDVGFNWDDASQAFVGDVDFFACEGAARAITPVPGGVGSVTTAVLATHVVRAAERMAF